MQMKDAMKNKNIIKYAVFVFFLFMMCYNLTHSALGGDEWVEYYYSQETILDGDLYNKIIHTFQPPLYNFLMHFWLMVSQSLLWFRCFNIVLGSISGIFLFKTLKKLCNEKIACFTLCVLAVCYRWVYCIQDCSEYALMLCCLFGTLYFYVMSFEKFSYRHMAFFILFNVLAIYSQYGSVFVVFPLLLLFFAGNIFDPVVDKKRKIVITLTYAACLLVFAAPLYFFFLQKQMAHNAIADNAVSFNADLLKDFPFILGTILGFFYDLLSGEIWTVLFSIIGFALIVLSVYVVAKGELGRVKTSLIITLLMGYTLHYFLVRLHIYAMAHPGQSAGFYVRYSYFYIPIMSVVLPIILLQFNSSMKESYPDGLYKYFVGISFVVCACLSCFSVLQNWNKTLDDQFAAIWMENEGWQDKTFVFGARYGFKYYVSHSDGYEEGYLSNTSYTTKTLDANNLPLHFWAWRTSWSGDGWQDAIDAATALGYTVTVYNNSGYKGQLAYCSYERETDNLEADDVSLSILDAEYGDDGLLHVQMRICELEDGTIKYNVHNYSVSYYILDSAGNIMQENNDKTFLKRWIDHLPVEIVIDTSQIQQRNYVIQFDIGQGSEEWLSDDKILCPSLEIYNGRIIVQ